MRRQGLRGGARRGTMIAVVQRVASAAVRVDGAAVATIGPGLLALVGALEGDGATDLEYMARRLPALRIFADEADRMNRSLRDMGGELLLVSQFTLAADTRKGNRPSFGRAMEPERAQELLVDLVARIRETGITVETGVFGARMQVELVNDGPVTLVLQSGATAMFAARGSG